MKNIVYLLCITAWMSPFASAQKIKTSEVPSEVMTSFKNRFPTVTHVHWEKENDKAYEAEFKWKGEETSANFDAAGNWLETETEIKKSTLPVAVQSALSSDFAGYKIEDASKLEHSKYGTCYEAEIEKGENSLEVLYTPEGKLLSKTQEKGEGRGKK